MPLRRPGERSSVGQDGATLSPGAEPNPSSFSNHLGKTHVEMEQLREENFDLKLQLDALRRSHGEAVAAAKRRTTRDGFYEYDEEDSLQAPYGTSGVGDANSDFYAELEQRMDHYRAESVSLKADNLQARADVDQLELALKRAQEELRTVRSAAAVQSHDLQAELDGVESDRIALRAQTDAAIADAVAGRHDAEKRTHSTQLRMSGLSMQLDATSRALEAERKNEEAVRVALNEARRVASELQKENNELKHGVDRRDRRTSAGKDVETTLLQQKEQLSRQEETISALNVKYEALRSQSVLLQQAKDAAARHPAGAENAGVELTAPGYELFEKLVAKLEKNGTGQRLVISGEGNQKRWREIVLNEMNDSLKDLYMHTQKLEADRASFIEAHCRTLLLKKKLPLQGSSKKRPLQESHSVPQ